MKLPGPLAVVIRWAAALAYLVLLVTAAHVALATGQDLQWLIAAWGLGWWWGSRPYPFRPANGGQK